MIMKIERGGRVAADFLSLVLCSEKEILCSEKEIRGGIPCVAVCNESQATGSAPVFLPPFFLMDGIVLAKGLGCPSRTFFE
jgi:hypothetical protein